MMAVQEATKPADANSSILIARSGNKDLINMSNTSYLSIREAPLRSLLEVINNQLLLIRINLLSLTCWCQFRRTTLNTCWKGWSCNAKLLSNGILAWWWFWSQVVKYSSRAFWRLSSFSWRVLLALTAAGTGPGMFIKWWLECHRTTLIFVLLSHNLRYRPQSKEKHSSLLLNGLDRAL